MPFLFVVDRGPGRRQVAVEGRRCPGAVGRQVGAGRGGHAAPSRIGQPEQAVDLVVGQLGRESCGARQGEAPVGPDVEHPTDRRLGVGAHRFERVGPLPFELVHEAMVRRCLTDGVEQVGRRADQFRERGTGDRDLGEAHTAEAVVARPATDVVGEELDLERGEGALVERHPLSRQLPRALVEIDDDGLATVEAQRHLRQPAVAHVGEGLREEDLVGGDGLVEIDAQDLAGGVVDGADAPRRGGVAVEGHGRAVLGRVGDRVSVGGGGDRGAVVLGHRERVVRGAGEDLEPLVGRVIGLGDLTGALGVAGGLAQRTPAVGPSAVGVGDQQVGALIHQVLAPGGVRGVGRGQEGRLLGEEDPGAGGAHHAVGVAGHQQGAWHGLSPEDLQRVEDGEGAEQGRVDQVGRLAELDLVDQRLLGSGDDREGFGERHRLAEAGRRGQQVPHLLRSRCAEPLELQVGPQQDVSHGERAGDRCHGLRFGQTLLHATVDRLQVRRRLR